MLNIPVQWGVGEKVPGEINDIRGYEKFKERSLAD
jgi:hypothetical protein